MNRPKTRNENIVVQEMKGELLIYDLQTNKAFCLNETSAMIYQLCNGTRSVAEIAYNMSVQLKTLVSEDFVWLTLNELKREYLLENDPEIDRFFKTVSRRELIKKAGLVSMVALPLVIGVSAPTAAMAASGGPIALFGACPSGSGCEAGLTCRSCFGCTPNTNVLSCCSNSNGGRGPGLTPSVSCALSNADCQNFASQQCCSGTATFTVTNCAGAGSGTCICN